MSALEQQPATVPLRWSSVRDCPRKAVYEATGAPRRDRTLTEERILHRGRAIGREFAIFLAAQERAKGRQPWRIFVASGVIGEWPRRYLTSDRAKAAFIVEEAVPWPLGILHPDIRVVETNTIVEVLSSAHASEAMIHSKKLQLVGQIEYTGAAGGAVVVVDPSNLSDEIFPLARSSKAYAELVDEMRARVATVQSWVDTGEIPTRVCSRPGDARSHFCLHAEHCFQGWEPPPPDLVLGSPDAIAVAGDVYRAKQVELEHKKTYDTAVSERKEKEQRLAQVIDLARESGIPKKIRIGALEVNRIEVADHQELALKKARGAGAWTDEHDEEFAQFLELRGGHVRYGIDRVGDQPIAPAPAVADVFGSVAPWTDADLGGDT
jgi:hypothetical protein